MKFQTLALHSLLVIMASALLTLTAGCISIPARTPATKPAPAVPKAKMTQPELQAAVMAYANRFIATIGQASFEFEKALPTPKARIIASNRRVYSLITAAEIAAGPNPGAALLDMMVKTSLSRIIWDEYWRPQVFGMPATIIVEAYSTLEKDIWSQAANVMTPAQMEELKEIIQSWRIDHPSQYVVDYIRFSDFGGIGKKPHLKKITQPGGLMAPIREATHAVDEVRMATERAMFLATKMQIIATFQVELAYRNFLFQPETMKMMKNIDQFSATAKELSRFTETFPQQISLERQAVLETAADLVLREREIILKEVTQLITGERKALLASLDGQEVQGAFKNINQTLDRLDKSFGQLHQTLSMADNLVAGSERTGLVFTELIHSVDQLAAKFESKSGQSTGKPFDINDYTQAMAQLEESSEQLSILLSSVNKTADDLSTAFLAEINTAAENRVDHIFYRLVQLCLLFGVMVFLIILFSNRIKKNQTQE